MRLRDDEGELVLPGEFIPAAERYNVVAAIDRWVVQRAVAGAAPSTPAAPSRRSCSRSISRVMSLSDRGFLDFVLAR